MSLLRICERCDKEHHEWTVREARIDLGRLQRKPMLCEDCTRVVEGSLRAALKPLAIPSDDPDHQRAEP